LNRVLPLLFGNEIPAAAGEKEDDGLMNTMESKNETNANHGMICIHRQVINLHKRLKF